MDKAKITLKRMVEGLYLTFGPAIFKKEDKTFLDTREYALNQMGYGQNDGDVLIDEEEFHDFMEPFLLSLMNNEILIANWEENIESFEDHILAGGCDAFDLYSVGDEGGRHFVAVKKQQE